MCSNAMFAPEPLRKSPALLLTILGSRVHTNHSLSHVHTDRSTSSSCSYHNQTEGSATDLTWDTAEHLQKHFETQLYLADNYTATLHLRTVSQTRLHTCCTLTQLAAR